MIVVCDTSPLNYLALHAHDMLLGQVRAHSRVVDG